MKIGEYFCGCKFDSNKRRHKDHLNHWTIYTVQGAQTSSRTAKKIRTLLYTKNDPIFYIEVVTLAIMEVDR